MSVFKKIALLIPAVRQVKTDLDNRRIRAQEFENENKILRERNLELTDKAGEFESEIKTLRERNIELADSVEFMKSQMSKALSIKDTAILSESDLASKLEHYQSQLAIMTSKYEKLRSEFETLEVENCMFKLANDDLIRKNSTYHTTKMTSRAKPKPRKHSASKSKTSVRAEKKKASKTAA